MQIRATVATLALLLISAASHARAQAPCEVVSFSDATKWQAPLSLRVTLQLTDTSLRDALARVVATSRIRLSYSPDRLPLERRVCIAADSATLGDVLSALLRGVAVQPVAAGREHAVLAPAQPDPLTSNSDSVIVLEPLHAGAEAQQLNASLPGVRVVVLHSWSAAQQASSTLASSLNGAVAGLWLWQQTPATPIVQYGIRGTSSFGLSAPKLYVDGIEVANPLLFSRISTDAIERIELVRGPQGAALFGANAINGVMNIVTRHGAGDAAAPRTRVRSTVGLAATDYASGVGTRHDHGVSVRAGDSTRSLLLNATAGRIGEFVPEGGGQHWATDVSARLLSSHTSISGTVRYVREEATSPLSPLLELHGVPPQLNERWAALSSRPIAVQQYTLGATASFTPTSNWTHTAVFGIDGYALDGVPELLPWASEADLALRAAGERGYRTTLRLRSTATMQLNNSVLGSVAVGAEQSELRQRGVSVAYPRAALVPVRHIGAPPQSYAHMTVASAPSSSSSQISAGLSAQGHLAVAERLFMTAGIRFERGSSDITDDHLATLPLVGGAYVYDVGLLSLRVRASYGKGIRWAQLSSQPEALQRLHAVQRSDLVPEEQSGIEVGVDLSIGRMLDLHVTRYDQTASGLVQRITIALRDTMKLPRAISELRYERQNIGEIGNRGWEMEASTAYGALSLAGTLSLVDSRVKQLAVGYRGDLLPGDRMLAVPAQTFSITAAFSARGWTTTLTAARAGDWINYDRAALASVVADSSRTAGDLAGDQLRAYWREYRGVTHMRASVTRALTRSILLTLTGDNLLDRQVGEPDNITIMPGRGFSLGLRAIF